MGPLLVPWQMSIVRVTFTAGGSKLLRMTNRPPYRQSLSVELIERRVEERERRETERESRRERE